MLFKGFRFGMLLQLALGPVCIFIFQTAAAAGFYEAETGVAGVALADGIFILSAILGIGALIKKEKVKSGMKIFGSVILLLFGINMVLGVFDINLIPSLNVSGHTSNSSSFVNAFVLTLSSPLTILFWAGVFSSKISEENMKRKDVYLFGIGAVLSTFAALTVVAVTGNLLKPLFSPLAMQILNLAVGMLLMFFGFRMLLKKKP